ncbi:hypothetical protein H5410_063826 [Solanum commersonii]|uniref:Uncharacterized protein n=1 Tax=Solanum commersonii TaxID=4109 RepID=A0A9J5WFP4_SOLCO|nr:hypothetical protein H5410_063826 [Solanum commersonii]
MAAFERQMSFGDKGEKNCIGLQKQERGRLATWTNGRDIRFGDLATRKSSDFGYRSVLGSARQQRCLDEWRWSTMVPLV